MKAKLKVDGKTIQELVVGHCEKIAFAAVVICFALIVYRALGREMAPVAPDNQPATPEKLRNSAADAEEHWQQTHPEPEPAIDYTKVAARSRKEIKVEDYLPPARGPETRGWKPWDRPIFKQLRKRGEPPLYPVEGFRGTADRGRLSLMVDVEEPVVAGLPGGETAQRMRPHTRTVAEVRGKRWVVLTGLVPYQEQVEAFEEYFKTVQKRGPHDFPVYRGYVVQRAEVTGPHANQPLDWSRTFYPAFAMQEAMESWGRWTGQGSQQLVDPRFVSKAPSLTFPLPPLVGRPWDASVVHEPEIPIYRAGFPGATEAGLPPPEPDVQDPFAAFDPNRPFQTPPAQFYPGGHDEGYAPPAPGGEGPMGGPTWSGDPREIPKYQLFRFFDFNVEPGKRYRYRVRLVLVNPNLPIKDRYLSKDVLEKKQRIEELVKKNRAEGEEGEARAAWREWELIKSDWTEPTEVISVPRDARLLALSVQPPAGPGADPTAKVMVVNWVEQEGIEGHIESSVNRGKVANFPDRPLHESSAKKPRRRPREPLGDLGEEGYYRGFEPDEPEPVAPTLYDYMTETLVVDMHGGERFSRRSPLTSPGAILVLSPDGNLVVRDELDDLAECTEIKQRTAPRGHPEEPYPYSEPGYGVGGEPGYSEFDGNLEELRGGRHDRRPKRGRRRPPSSRGYRGNES